MNEKEKDRIIISREKKAHVASKYYYMPTKGSLQILLRGQKKKIQRRWWALKGIKIYLQCIKINRPLLLCIVPKV